MPKKPYNKKRYTKRVSKATKTYVKKALKLDKEPKFNLPRNTSEVTSTPSFIELSGPAQGDTALTREGNLIKLRKLELNFHLLRKQTSTSANPWDFVRIMVVQWKVNSASVPLDDVGYILQDDTTYPWISPYTAHQVDKKRFHVLYDKKAQLTYFNGAQPLENHTKTYKKTINLDKLSTIRFVEGSTEGQNKLFLIFFGGYATGIQSSTLEWNCVTHWIDV